MGLKLEVKNTPPEPPFLLVSNHLSYLDVFVLFAQLRCLFVAKSDVKTWPLIGFIIRTSGILFIDRHRKRDVTRVNKLISSSINENQGIILFAEGTTSPGMDILPFRTSLLEYPATHNFEVSHAAISYATPSGSIPAYQAICWWDNTPFFAHFFNFLKLRKCTAKVTFGQNRISETDRKKLAVKLQEAVGQEFEIVISKKDFFENHGVFKPILP
jgi:1-acyl-sn-glycerol-3-phosphate acyltransferase